MQSAEVRRGVGRMETGHSSAHDRGEDRVQGDDAEGKSGGVTLDTGDVVIGRGDPPPSSGSGVLAAPELHSDLHAVVERVVDVLHAVGPFHSASLPIPSSTSLSCMSQKKLFDHMTTMKQLTTFFSMFGFLSVSEYFATSTSHSSSELFFVTSL